MAFSSMVSPLPLSSSHSSLTRPAPFVLPLKPVRFAPSSRPSAFVAAAAGDASPTPALSPPMPQSARKQKHIVSSKPRKQQVMLRFVWMDKNIGLALDQVVPDEGTVPLSPYFFWPRKDAWEEIKTKLESKKWISRKQTILLLNQATDIINLWQQNATG